MVSSRSIAVRIASIAGWRSRFFAVACDGLWIARSAEMISSSVARLLEMAAKR
ncbi:hypothetical protein [Bradyrhizobium centrolobii]|uniref:hypothetical protein n=1 Tax=Bradyrhizobium centrolobii TaxID=1505087 RepID=UPI000A521D46|nr:hypothetical protein [Bradyrhizobium centrolobii]